MRVQEAIRRQLVLTSTATYALVGTRVYWTIAAKNQTAVNWVEIRKASHRPMTAAALDPRRLPAEMVLEVICFAKSQDAAADIADAVSSDLIGQNGDWPTESPVPAETVHINGIAPADEEDLRSEEAYELGLFAERRTFIVRYR